MSVAVVETEMVAVPAPEEAVSSRSSSVPLLWLLAAQIPLWFAYGNHLGERPHYQFFPLAVVAAAFMIGFRLRRETNLQPGSRKTCIRLLFLGLGLETLAFALHSYWLIGASLPLSFLTFVYAIGGWRSVRRSWTAITLLLLCVPIPFNFDWKLVWGLRDLTSFLGSDVLNFFRIPHIRNGNVLEVAGKQLFVAEACSGVNSLFSSLCCVLVWAGLTRMHWLETVVLLAAAVFWLIAANSLRVIVVALGVGQWNLDLTSGWKHEALGVGTFAMGLFFTWNTHQLIGFLFRPRVRGSRRFAVVEQPTFPLPSPKLPFATAGGMALLTCGILLSVGFLALYRKDIISERTAEADRIIERFGTFAQKDLHEEGNGWRLEEFQAERRELSSNLGEYSQVWRGRIGPFKTIASIDYPFQNWHDLSVCYRNEGWQVGKPIEIPSPLDDGPAIMEVRMQRPGFQAGYLIFSLYDFDGKVLPPPKPRSGFYRPESLLGRVMGNDLAESEMATYQVQVFVIGNSDTNETLRSAAIDLYKTMGQAARTRLNDQ